MNNYSQSYQNKAGHSNNHNSTHELVIKKKGKQTFIFISDTKVVSQM